MEQKQLKPCPFCGGKADEFTLLKNDVRIRYVIQCENQCSSTYPVDSEEEAIKAWNKRVNEQTRS